MKTVNHRGEIIHQIRKHPTESVLSETEKQEWHAKELERIEKEKNEGKE